MRVFCFIYNNLNKCFPYGRIRHNISKISFYLQTKHKKGGSIKIYLNTILMEDTLTINEQTKTSLERANELKSRIQDYMGVKVNIPKGLKKSEEIERRK